MDAPVLELREVSVKGRQQPRLDQVQLSLHAGERLALLGPSGAGKSTLLAVANGLLQADQGQVLWGGETLSRRPRIKRRQQQQIGTLWQDLRLIEELSVQQNLNCGRLAQWGWPKALLNLLLPIETEACAAALRQLDLDPALLAQSVGQLSGGQRQRVAIARLLRQDPLLWLADEPLSSLDPRLAGELLQLLLEQTAAPRALVMSLHRPDLLAGFSRVVGLREGRILFDCAPEQIEPQALQRLYAGSTTP
ncbi:phosphonate ABC transporter ATP-binding protein [Synechococcus sp. LTW-G]